MATIKGQNLRVLVGDTVIAGATSCTLHVGTNIASRTSKDSPDDWEENQIVSKNWDITTDALVFAYTSHGPSAWDGTNASKATITSTTYYIVGATGSQDITLQPGDSIILEGSDVTNLAILGNSHSSVLVSSSTGIVRYTNNTANARTVCAAVYGSAHTAAIDVFVKDAICLEDLLSSLTSGTSVTVKFASMTGSTHRTVSTVYRQGTAIVTDLTVNAQNRELSTYTAKFTGTGALSIPTP